MSKRNGFTLVELMVVIVIIGVLAAVAIPKMMAAVNKAKASEGPQILGSIVNMQHAFQAEYNNYATCAVTTNESGSNAGTVSGGWEAIGMSQNPYSKYFNFQVTGAAGTGAPANFPTGVPPLNDFTATATLFAKLGDAAIGNAVSVDELDDKEADAKLNLLIGSYGAKNKGGE